MLIHHYVIDCPWPTQSGGDLRNAAIAAALGKIPSAEYRCFGLTPMKDHDCGGRPYQKLPFFDKTNPWRSFSEQCPTQLQWSSKMLAKWEEHFHHSHVDLAVFEGVAWASVIQQCQAKIKKVVVDMHNIESDLWLQQIRCSKWTRRLRQLLFHPRAASRTRDLDAKLSREVNHNWVCSVPDRLRLETLGGIAQHRVPNPLPDESVLQIPIDVARYAQAQPLFIGHLSYFPNVDAVTTLAKAWTSHEWARSLPYRPCVAGRSPSKKVRKLAQLKKVELEVAPTSTFPLLKKAGYSVMPLRFGSGTRIKILEACAAGVVVVASRVAAEGLDLMDGTHFIQCDTPSEAITQIRELTRSPERAARIADQARKWVIQHHSQSSIQSAVGTAIQDLRFEL